MGPPGTGEETFPGFSQVGDLAPREHESVRNGSGGGGCGDVSFLQQPDAAVLEPDGPRTEEEVHVPLEEAIPETRASRRRIEFFLREESPVPDAQILGKRPAENGVLVPRKAATGNQGLIPVQRKRHRLADLDTPSRIVSDGEVPEFDPGSEDGERRRPEGVEEVSVFMVFPGGIVFLSMILSLIALFTLINFDSFGVAFGSQRVIPDLRVALEILLGILTLLVSFLAAEKLKCYDPVWSLGIVYLLAAVDFWRMVSFPNYVCVEQGWVPLETANRAYFLFQIAGILMIVAGLVASVKVIILRKYGKGTVR